MSQPILPLHTDRGSRFGPLLPRATLAGFVIALLTVLLIAFLSYRSLDARTIATERVANSFEVTEQTDAVLSTLKDAETGQRGFLLTGEEPYLEPYTNAKAELAGEIKSLRRLVGDEPQQQQRIDTLDNLGNEKMAELAQTIAIRRKGDFDGALAIIRTDRGKTTMDRIRTVVAQLKNQERSSLDDRQEAWASATVFSTVVSFGGAGVLLILILMAAAMTSREHRRRETEVWLRTGQMRLSAQMQGEQRLDTLGGNVLTLLSEYLSAQVGSIYIAETDGRLHRFAGYALPVSPQSEAIRPGDGLVGQTAKDKRALHVRAVPEGYLPVVSSLGQSKAAELLLAPAIHEGVVQAVVELGFFQPVQPSDLELLARASEAIAIAVRSSKDRTRLEELLTETQRQAEELQTQQEELRVSNEELEEQGRALKESQARLEAQHAELEQNNSQLEEQTQLLESQKSDLSHAQVALTDKAHELARSSQYKSEFLANMSHELRTPLNSSLILAKLLSDNKDGNLTPEQVKFAQTISSAGNDLLALINDVLDLSKIESGKMDVQPGPVVIGRTIESLVRALQPLAQDKGITLTAMVEPGTPERMETDSQRLGQILKNLLANALKFTERGEVSLQVGPGPTGKVSFAIQDTGVGIPPDQHEVIFEAFRQADGSTHRRFGGTGLGLSISRDLARLLGGDISIQSAPGQGSTFTLTLPVTYAGATASEPARSTETRSVSRHARHEPALSPPTTAPVTLAPAEVEDDRAQLDATSRLILVLEDDEPFATILRDLAHELGFQCVVTHSARDGLAAATTYRPSAILLDMNLPDHSGLGVLDQLKRDPLTRHIPVHVISVTDYTTEAMSLGAVGYALKPVKRDELIDAFRKVENKLSQSVRRVLVVEDDQRQRESVRQLLGSEGVQIVCVESANDALAQLKTSTFDCVVMDLNLPDLNGYELLEKMSEQEDVSFPPVIIYTGRSLTRDEEHGLRRFSRSIIIKDARSPERLLDEVTLFLHQVEATLPPERQRMLKEARDREAALEGRRVLVVEDDVRNIFALSSVLEPKGLKVQIARNGKEALDVLTQSAGKAAQAIDLVLMDIMMPEMDGITAMREIRKRPDWQRLPIIALTAKAMKDDREKCLAAGASDYIAKPLDVEKLLSLVRVWMPK